MPWLCASARNTYTFPLCATHCDRPVRTLGSHRLGGALGRAPSPSARQWEDLGVIEATVLSELIN